MACDCMPHYTIMEPTPACMVTCWQLVSILWSALHLYPSINLKQLEPWLIGLCDTLPVFQVSVSDAMCCFWCYSVNEHPGSSLAPISMNFWRWRWYWMWFWASVSCFRQFWPNISRYNYSGFWGVLSTITTVLIEDVKCL